MSRGRTVKATAAPTVPSPVSGGEKGGSQAEGAAPRTASADRERKHAAKQSKRRRPPTDAFEERIGYHFKNPALLDQALTHISALAGSRNRAGSYQRLEFLGDHVLGLVVSDMLYHAFPNADEGELSKRLAELVRKESCADVAKTLGLADDIKLGAVGAGAGARLRKSVLGDICEAVIGAIYLDGGYPAASAFVERHWTERMLKNRRPMRDAKTALQEWAQSKALPTPVYREVERTGPHHDPHFRVAVTLPGLEPAEGVGGTLQAGLEGDVGERGLCGQGGRIGRETVELDPRRAPAVAVAPRHDERAPLRRALRERRRDPCTGRRWGKHGATSEACRTAGRRRFPQR